jgi:membrane protein
MPGIPDVYRGTAGEGFGDVIALNGSRGSQPMRQGASTEKRSGRRPEGPPHPRDASILQTLKRTVTEFKEDNLTDAAAALTYFSVLSIFPALIALVSIVGVVGDPQTITQTLTDIVSSFGPESAIDTFKGPIEDVTRNQGTAGVTLIIGLVSALWTASGYVGAFIRASNNIYEVEEGRSFFKLRPLQMLVTLVLILLLAAVLVSIVLTGPIAKEVGSAIGFGDTAVTIWNIAKWPVLLAIVLFMIALLYYSAPNVKLRGFKWVTPGSVLAIVIWLLASVGFAIYVANFGSYNKIYGTLAGVIIFLVWLWITNVSILLGAELNSELERSREIEEGRPGAEREIQLEERSVPKEKKKDRTA